MTLYFIAYLLLVVFCLIMTWCFILIIRERRTDADVDIIRYHRLYIFFFLSFNLVILVALSFLSPKYSNLNEDLAGESLVLLLFGTSYLQIRGNIIVAKEKAYVKVQNPNGVGFFRYPIYGQEAIEKGEDKIFIAIIAHYVVSIGFLLAGLKDFF